MADVKRNAVLPKGEENGLAAIAPELAAEAAHRRPKRLRAAIVIFDARRLATDSDTGEEVVTVRFRRVEPLLGEDLGAAEKLLRRALESRSGQTTLPLELEDEIRATFEALGDITAGEDDGPEGKGKAK
jgi:hypothetical protein